MLSLTRISDTLDTEENFQEWMFAGKSFLCKCGHYVFASVLDHDEELGFYVDCDNSKTVYPVDELSEIYLINEE